MNHAEMEGCSGIPADALSDLDREPDRLLCGGLSDPEQPDKQQTLRTGGSRLRGKTCRYAVQPADPFLFLRDPDVSGSGNVPA